MNFFSREEERKKNNVVALNKRIEDERIKKLESLTQEKNALEKKEIAILKRISQPLVKLKEELKDCRLQQKKIKEKIRSIKKSFR